ncbi:hypothetical protein B2D45_07160 [Lactobacillus hilgardii]|uniref:Uncharacterized protein n=1 Tax=Lentilactobacillus hilgardii (strain ATCC 8290 / DSM 20176 / CCUG 30140 / JCM 1155 / KCTC 3500 / NBRC 15886 / NCIMB 8040 / NRRL B-1843 / 9) TaxID=1423757 RepID=C0XK57_LENH9|nr:hypothetical protein HMPREF0497_0828 [Lentilactobacillus buchneri ATCC 11577]EEI24241.1 hypothetical protein HMPREF0519_1618 [Lentilactobacillus hilgardii DSM 20176 = ATCC 8290]MCT3397045.1 hypothetical protein [Lentilactobacillus hilgardii]QEU37930.1 hypothetical protein LH500_02705 [Lentilactobacillus hilgardii]
MIEVQWHPKFLFETMPEEKKLFESSIHGCNDRIQLNQVNNNDLKMVDFSRRKRIEPLMI